VKHIVKKVIGWKSAKIFKPVVLSSVALAAGIAFSAQTYKVTTDVESCIYKCGQTATFTVTVADASHLNPSEGPQVAVLDNFGPMQISSTEVVLTNGATFSVSGTLAEPGFLRLTLPATKKGGSDPHVFSVGFEPEKIKKGSPSPADFDEFWASARAKLAAEVPLDPKMDLVPERSSSGFDFYRISFATFGRRVYGYMSVPKDSAKAPFPVHVGVNAAGFGSWTNDMSGERDCIRVQFSVYPFEPDWKWKETGLEEKYKALGAEARSRYGASTYATGGISSSREEYFFYPVILGIDRALDWIAARPDVDRKRFTYEGTSQGGGFGFYLCGLNRVFTKAAFYVPAITDTMGYLKGRMSGWPRIIEGNSSSPEGKAVAEKWAPYFDGANFASRIKCPVRVAVGFSDMTCPPCAVYAAYNEICVADKGIEHGIGMTHSCFPQLYKKLGEWVRAAAQSSSAQEPYYDVIVAGGGPAVIGAGYMAADVPFSAIRLRKPQTDRAEVWKATLEQFAKYRAGVDEVWFSTGICFPKMDEHRAAAKRLAAAAEDLRKLGILPSLQIQATIGHSDDFTYYADNSGITWQTYVPENGATAKTLNCFRAPEFLAYMREMASVYAEAVKPYAVWIDDDIRIVSHGGPGFGCYCEHCLALFAKKEGREYARQQLAEEMKKDAALAARWRAFSFEGEAALVRTIGEAVHAASPGTRMCQQQPFRCYPEHRLLYEACHETTGLPVGMRPGAGAYFDYDPRDQIAKAYYLALQIDTIGPLSFIDRICPEIESCPRSFACRSGRGVLLEGLEALSQGMNSLSALVIDAGFETPEWYGSEILAPLARNAALLKRYVAVNEGARRCGYGFTGTPPTQLQTASLPLSPLLRGARSELAHIVTTTAAKNAVEAGSYAVTQLLSGGVLIDGAAAEILFAAGYGAAIGLDGIVSADGALRERFLPIPVNDGFKARETPVSSQTLFLKPAAGVTAISEYYSDANNEPLNLPGVAAVMFETKSGLRRVVFGTHAFTAGLSKASGDRVMQLHRLADWASHGKSPVLIETPTRSFVQPRVRKDGSLASVVFVNASIGETAPVKLRLRGVPSAVEKAVWSSLDTDDAALAVVRDGADALVTLPPVPAWTGGYLFFEGAAEPIPAFIFGQNLEHTRSAVQGGISAQLVRNRKFAGKPSRKGVSMMWEPYGSRAVYDRASFGCTRHAVKSQMHRINEIGCQVIGSLEPDGEAGIRQDCIGVRGGVKHTFKAVVSSWNPEDTTMTLRATAADGRVLAERDFTVNTKTRKDWTHALCWTSRPRRTRRSQSPSA